MKDTLKRAQVSGAEIDRGGADLAPDKAELRREYRSEAEKQVRASEKRDDTWAARFRARGVPRPE